MQMETVQVLWRMLFKYNRRYGAIATAERPSYVAHDIILFHTHNMNSVFMSTLHIAEQKVFTNPGRCTSDMNCAQGNPREGNPREGNPREGNPREENTRPRNPSTGENVVNECIDCLLLQYKSIIHINTHLIPAISLTQDDAPRIWTVIAAATAQASNVAISLTLNIASETRVELVMAVSASISHQLTRTVFALS